MSLDDSHSLPLAEGWRLWRHTALRSAGMPFAWLDAFRTDPAGERSRAVRRLLREDRFVEALVWQNPVAARNWVLRHATALRAGAELKRRGTHDVMAARYAQRYCGKNDTIGFFGPVAWAAFGSADEGLVSSGEGGIRRRGVHLESWAVAALADAWATEERVIPWLPVRMHPAASFDGESVRRGWKDAERVDAPTRAVLSGLAEAASVADLVSATAAELGGPEHARARIMALRDAQILDVGFVVPLHEWPERDLRAQVERVPHEAVRRDLLGRLDELEHHRDAVAGAAGDLTAVHEALQDLIAFVTKATGRAGTRGKSEVAVGRVPVYQDCRRDLDVELGADLLDGLRAPLSVLLGSARWLVAEVADAVHGELLRRFRTLARRKSDVRLSQLYVRVADVLSGSPGTVVHDVVDDFRLRWAELLATGEGSPLRLSSAEVGPLGAVLFPARSQLWSTARYHSPDLMLSRRPEGWQWVLGELHLAMNTLENRVFHTQSDDPRALNAYIGEDMAAGRVVALHPLDSPEVSPRTYPPLTSHREGVYHYWSYGRDSGPPAGCRSVPASEIRVTEEDGVLMAASPDGAWRAPVIEVLGEFMSALVANRFDIREPAPHQPRVLLDDMVVCRESWRVSSDVLDSRPEASGVLAAQLRARGMPRHVFARTPAEPKPFYVDLESPLLLRNLGRALRLLAGRPEQDRRVTLSEMLPGPEELWLTDSGGDRYTSEFRAVVVDETPAVPVTVGGTVVR